MKIAHDMDRVFTVVGLPRDKYGIALTVKGRRPSFRILTRKEWRELGWKPLPLLDDFDKVERCANILNREHFGLTPTQAHHIDQEIIQEWKSQLRSKR